MTAPPAAQVAIGDSIGTLELPPLDRATLALFAGASGDHNPIHIDADFARRAGMPDVFAQGMLGMAWMGRLLTNWMPQARLRQLNARFLGITHLGHIIRCTGTVTEHLKLAGEPCARIEIRAVNQYGQTKIVGEAVVALE